MNRRVIGGIAVAGVLLLVIMLWDLSRRREPPVISEPATTISAVASSTAATQASTTASAAPLYIIGSWNDKLAVFRPPDSAPYQVYDVYLSSFPEDERQRLESGIAVYDEQSLNSLLEDYTS